VSAIQFPFLGAIIDANAPQRQDAISSTRVSKPKKKRGVFSRAFWNQYNLILLGGVGLFAIATFSWLPLLIGAGAEALWMLLGADSKPFKRWVAKQESKERQAELAAKATAALETLDETYVEHFQELRRLSERIEELGESNPSLGTRLVQGEMDKLGMLLHSYLDMAVLHQRYAHYLAENPDRDIRRDIQTCQSALDRERDAEVKASLQQNLELARKRLRQHERIEANHRLLSVKMDTLEKAFRYLESHIIGIGKGEELSAEIDGLVLGVDSVEEMQRETAGLLGDDDNDLRRAAARRQAARR
jgi:hypothetical protein